MGTISIVLLIAVAVVDLVTSHRKRKRDEVSRGLIYSTHNGRLMQPERNRVDHWDLMEPGSKFEYPCPHGGAFYWALSFPRRVEGMQ